MAKNKRFGLKATTRYRIYQWLSLLIFGLLLFGGEHQLLALIPFGLLMAWMLVVDPIGRDGERTIFGIPAKNVGKYVRSVFGRDLND